MTPREQPATEKGDGRGVVARVLVIEDDPDFSFLMDLGLRSAGHDVTLAASMHDALEAVEADDRRFDVVLLDLGLPDLDGMAGLRAASEHLALPVVVLTGDGRDQTRADADRIGAAAFLVKGQASTETISRTLQRVIATPERSLGEAVGLGPYDGPAEVLAATMAILAAHTALGCWAFIRTVGSTEIVLVRHGEPNLPSGAPIRWNPVVERRFATGCWQGHDTEILGTDQGALHAASAIAVPLGRGAERYGVLLGWSSETVGFTTPMTDLVCHEAQVILTNHLLEEDRSRAVRRAGVAGAAAAIDALTGLGNRRAYNTFLQAEESRCERTGHGATVFVIDLDGLKSVNDRFGHAAGDRYLRNAAAALSATVRAGDAVFRIGGDEFAMVAVGCDDEDARLLESRLRELLDDHEVRASIGWAARPPAESLSQAARMADREMYEEKSARRSTDGPARS